MRPHLNTEPEIQSHGLKEGSKKFRRLGPNIYSVRCSASFLPTVCKNSLINTFNASFTFPNLVVFLTYAIMRCTGCFLLAPLVLSIPFFPTHWQPLDLESTAAIVIYVLSHDRCARIVLSIRPSRLKVTARSGFNHCIFSPTKKWKCHRTFASIGPGSSGAVTSCCRRQNPEFTLVCASEKGYSAPEKYQARMRSWTGGHSESGCRTHFISQDIWSLLIKDVTDVLLGKHGSRSRQSGMLCCKLW